MQRFLYSCYRRLPAFVIDFQERPDELSGLLNLARYLDSPKFERWVKARIEYALEFGTVSLEEILDWLPRLEEMDMIQDQAKLLHKLATLLMMEGRSPTEVGLRATNLAGDGRLSGVAAQALMGAIAAAAAGGTPDLAMIQRLMREGPTHRPHAPSTHTKRWTVDRMYSTAVCTETCRLHGHVAADDITKGHQRRAHQEPHPVHLPQVPSHG